MPSGQYSRQTPCIGEPGRVRCDVSAGRIRAWRQQLDHLRGLCFREWTIAAERWLPETLFEPSSTVRRSDRVPIRIDLEPVRTGNSAKQDCGIAIVRAN